MNKKFSFFATTPKGLELLLVDELGKLGAKDPAEKLAGVTFSGDLTLAYKACLWSRLANRILLQLTHVSAASPEELYAGAQTIDWSEHIPSDGSFAVHFVTSQSNMTHSLFGAQKVKDAIVDQMRNKFGIRPNVDREKPDVWVYVYLHRNKATFCIDLSGESLHKRGYRLKGGPAPLKENLAAAILLRAGWVAIAKNGGSLLDPMCGSGTFLIEAVLLASDTAPGLLRDYFGFLGWQQHNPKLWASLLQEAKNRQQQGYASLPDIIGYDHNPLAIKAAFDHIDRAGLRGKIHVEKRELADFSPKKTAKPGLIVANPPYGERLGEIETLKPLYNLLGEKLKQAFIGWRAAVLTGSIELGKQMGIRAHHQYALFNGALPCKLLLFDVETQFFVDRSQKADNERRIRAAKKAIKNDELQAVQMFVNRLRKNLKHLQRKAKREGKTAYRIYDADIPEYAFVIDLNDDEVYIKEYQAPKGVDESKVLKRRNEVLSLLPELLNVSPAKINFSIIPRN